MTAYERMKKLILGVIRDGMIPECRLDDTGGVNRLDRAKAESSLQRAVDECGQVLGYPLIVVIQGKWVREFERLEPELK